MHIILHSFTILLLLATLLPLVRSNHWAIRIFDYPRVQKFVLTSVLLVTYLFFYSFQQDGLYVLLLLMNWLFLTYQIYPYTKFASKQVLDAPAGLKVGKDISVISWNVFQDNDTYSGIDELIEKYDPDILILLETDKKWVDAALTHKDRFVDHKVVPQENTYGMLVLSKFKFTHCEVNYLIDDEVPSIKIRSFVVPGREFEVNILHPKPPVPTESVTSTARDQELIVVGRRIRDSDYPTLVLGDLNDVAWSHTTDRFQQLSGLLDARRGRGLFNTFNAKYRLLQFPIDHIFSSQHFTLRHLATLPAYGSDHYPIHGIFNYSAINEQIQAPMDASADIEKEADEELKKFPE